MSTTINVEDAALIAEAVALRLERHFDVIPTYTLEQAAEKLGVGVDQMRRLCAERVIPHVRVGKFYRIKPADLNNYMDANYHPAKGVRA